MRYYENSLGLFISEDAPAGSTELTEEEFESRLEEIRQASAQRATEAENMEEQENNDN